MAGGDRMRKGGLATAMWERAVQRWLAASERQWSSSEQQRPSGGRAGGGGRRGSVKCVGAAGRARLDRVQLAYDG
jgi:hypothetical protein